MGAGNSGDGPFGENAGRAAYRYSSVTGAGTDIVSTVVDVGPLRFDALIGGPPSGELVVLLHGFPQTSASWSAQLSTLATAGYRVVAPDQRGYSPGARPDDVASYRIEHLVDDALGVASALGHDRFHLVGHDWGGAIGWAAASWHPGRVRSLTVVSTPHPRALARALAGSLQAVRSAYIPFFQLPWLPETVLGARGGAVLRRLLVATGLSVERADRYLETLGSPGALRAATNWYRANGPGLVAAIGRIRSRTLYVWSSRDFALGKKAATGTGRYVDGPFRFEVLDGVSHWVPEECPDELDRLLLEHLAGGAPNPSTAPTW